MPRVRPASATKSCPRDELHAPDEPNTTPALWTLWAEVKAEHFRQLKCPGCGLYKVWIPRVPTSV